MSTIAKELDNFQTLGNGLTAILHKKRVDIWRNGAFLFCRDVDPRAVSSELRRLVLDLCLDYRVHKTKVSVIFSISRQSIDNWIYSFQKYGIIGLENSTKNQGNSNRTKGSKNKQHANERAFEKQKIDNLQPSFKDIQVPKIKHIDHQDEPYSQTQEEQSNRYAGVFVIIILLVSKFKLFNWLIGIYGGTYKIFMIFILMSAKGIRSIEQLKNIRSKEAGSIIGISKIPSLPGVWSMFYQASKKQLSQVIMSRFFSWQIMQSLISNRFWFTDGHVLPYSGKKKMHLIFNTKKREVEPGCVSFVSCDIKGKIIDFEIKEGGAGLRQHIIKLHDKWKTEFNETEYPVHVFDREGDGCDFFYELVKLNCPFVTWEKNSNKKKINGLPMSDFESTTTINGTKYLFFENQKEFCSIDSGQKQNQFKLRRFYIINTSTNKRTSALAFNGKTQLSQQDCIYAILNRWGASENTFKHMGDRQPMSYRPGFKLVKSENQTIPNPEIKIIEKQIKSINKEYLRKCEKLALRQKNTNKSGKIRANDAYSNLKLEAEQLKLQKTELVKQKSELPLRLNISGLDHYRSFETHDNEGKNLFDFIGSLVWNVRKKGVEILEQLYPHTNDVVDLFYAIINSHGTVKISEKVICVTLEPLQQASRRIAQIEFCKKLTLMGAKTNTQKAMIIKVMNK